MRVRLIVAICVASVFGIGVVAALSAVDDCTTYQKLVNGRYSHSYEHWSAEPDRRVGVTSPGSLRVRITFEAANTFDQVAGFTAGDVSAAVGFDVSWHGTLVSDWHSVHVPDQRSWAVEAGTVNDVFVFDIESYNGCTDTPLGRPEQATAERVGPVITRDYPEP